MGVFCLFSCWLGEGGGCLLVVCGCWGGGGVCCLYVMEASLHDYQYGLRACFCMHA